MEFWLYILLGFFGGTITCFLFMMNAIRRFIGLTIKIGKENDN